MTQAQVANGVDIASKAMQYVDTGKDQLGGSNALFWKLRILFGDDIVEAALRQLTGKSPACANPLDANEIVKQTTESTL